MEVKRMSFVCPFCGVYPNDWVKGYENDFVMYYFFECGNAYSVVEDYWIDHCCNEVKFP